MAAINAMIALVDLKKDEDAEPQKAVVPQSLCLVEDSDWPDVFSCYLTTGKVELKKSSSSVSIGSSFSQVSVKSGLEGSTSTSSLFSMASTVAYSDSKGSAHDVLEQAMQEALGAAPLRSSQPNRRKAKGTSAKVKSKAKTKGDSSITTPKKPAKKNAKDQLSPSDEKGRKEKAKKEEKNDGLKNDLKNQKSRAWHGAYTKAIQAGHSKEEAKVLARNAYQAIQ